MDARFERDTGRTVELRHDHALRPIDYERPLRGHERDLAHVNFLFLGPLLLSELESDVERRAVGLALPLRFERGQLRLADLVMGKIEGRLLIVAFDRENFLEHCLETRILPLGEWDVFLEKIDV
jgi:hypothetical protein